MRRSALALFVVAVAGCGITDPSVTLHIQGTVTAQATGQSIAGARIDLYRSFIEEPVGTTTTDSQGRYSLSSKMGNCFENDLGSFVGASASGFAGDAAGVLCNSALQQIDFSLAPPATP
jgi:hypothetical protein